jgi:hypothetical protein
MSTAFRKIGIVVECWDRIRRDPETYELLLRQAEDHAASGSVIFLSLSPTAASTTLLRERLPRSFITDQRLLSVRRLQRLCKEVFNFDGKRLTQKFYKKERGLVSPRFGLIVSNGHGLGHVARMKMFAEGLKPYGPCGFMSLSASMREGAFYIPSPQYLELNKTEGHFYTHEAVRQFFNRVDPTHVFYDGNVLPEGMLAALSKRPHVHLTWIRRGMWPHNASPGLMAQQALADLVIEPGEIAESYDMGPSWNDRLNYCTPGAFLKTLPIFPSAPALGRKTARGILKLDQEKRYALVMLGAVQKPEDAAVLRTAVRSIQKAGLTPVIAHWPMSHTKPPSIEGVPVIEQMPIAPYFKAFDVIVSAAGYNSFHEILAAKAPVIFTPQEDAGRDVQAARAAYATDQGWSYYCQRSELELLSEIIPHIKELKPAECVPRLDNWKVVIEALGKNLKRSKESLQEVTLNVDRRVLHEMHRRWRRDSQPYKTKFVLALDMDYETFSQKVKKKREDFIVVTNSIDPVQLRRAGYKYVWLNEGTNLATKRQFMNWLKVWKPQKIVSLKSKAS